MMISVAFKNGATLLAVIVDESEARDLVGPEGRAVAGREHRARLLHRLTEGAHLLVVKDG